MGTLRLERLHDTQLMSGKQTGTQAVWLQSLHPWPLRYTDSLSMFLVEFPASFRPHVLTDDTFLPPTWSEAACPVAGLLLSEVMELSISP